MCQCNRKFTYETKRPLRVRLKEHKRNVKLEYTNKRRIADLSSAEDHNINWNEVSFQVPEDSNRFPTAVMSIKVSATYFYLKTMAMSKLCTS